MADTDGYLISFSDKATVNENDAILRSQDDKLQTSVDPNDILLSSIILGETTVSAKVYTENLVLSSIILEQAVPIVPAMPEDLILSGIILGQTQQAGKIDIDTITTPGIISDILTTDGRI